MPNELWQTTANHSHLKDGDIDIWRGDLCADSTSLGAMFGLLSDDEKERAGRYVFERDKERFITGRGMLRKILSSYLGIAPGDVRFSYGPFGKPFLANGTSRLRFNVSHSNGVGVIAITTGRDIGVDIEFVDQSFQIFSVAGSVFSAVEVSRLAALPARSRAAAFFTGWTRKEACLKATGDGLSSEDKIQSAIPAVGEENAVSFSICSHHEIREWSLISLGNDDDYKLALAVEGKLGAMKHCEFSVVAREVIS